MQSLPDAPDLMLSKCPIDTSGGEQPSASAQWGYIERRIWLFP